MSYGVVTTQTRSRGAVSRADLLRVLDLSQRLGRVAVQRLRLDENDREWLGYVWTQRGLADAPTDHATVSVPIANIPQGESPRLPLQMAQTFAKVEHRILDPQPDTAAHLPRREVPAPIDEDSAAGASKFRLVDFEELIPQARLIPALRRHLGATRSGGLDVGRIVGQLAVGALARLLPRKQHRRWHPDLVVVLDCSMRLWPYREDMYRLARALVRACGKYAVSIRLFDRGPEGGWIDWLAAQNLGLALKSRQDWTMPPSGTPVLLVGDLGLLKGVESPVCQSWRAFVGSLRAARTQPLGLLPLAAEQIDGTIAALLPILNWSPDGCARLLNQRGGMQQKPAGLDELLAMLSTTRRIDPPLLRALRKRNSVAAGSAGLEGAVWCHEDIEASTVAELRSERQHVHLHRFETLPAPLQQAQGQVLLSHHAHLRAVVSHEEMLCWAAHASEGAQGDPVMQRAAFAAETFLQRMAATIKPGEAGFSESDALRWFAVARDIEARADPAMWGRHRELLSDLVAARVGLARSRGEAATVPDAVDPAALAARLGLTSASKSVAAWLVRDARTSSVVIQASPAILGQSLISTLNVESVGFHVRIGDSRTALSRWWSPSQFPVSLLPLDDKQEIRIETATETLAVALVQRPRGSKSWHTYEGGVRVVSPPLCGHAVDWRGDELIALAPSARSVAGREPVLVQEPRRGQRDSIHVGPKGPKLVFGLDEFGVFAEFRLVATDGHGRQRLRWIEPGTFLMGSPEDEPERNKDEGPQHQVTIGEGFWLADTACTQGLWKAVTGRNPSGFMGDSSLPVEQVSWYDVHGFLRQLELVLPGMRATLPTEAEWEYACRVGATPPTPFSFGDLITPAQLNYDGSYPYNGGAEGEFRKMTVPVKSLPANAWGLYEMHGNLWEWCSDGQRKYDGQPQRDPFGPVGPDALRALRGGSWGDRARGARAASRFARVPSYAGGSIGFRLSLRSIQPSPAAPGGPDDATPDGVDDGNAA